MSPVPNFIVNANFSYLHSKVSQDKFLANPRDPSGGRSDTVIIKDITNASNCAVVPLAGGAATSNGFVTARSEEHTSELQSLMRISYAVFCLTKKKNIHNQHN